MKQEAPRKLGTPAIHGGEHVSAVLDHLSRATPMAAWIWEADAVHLAWLAGLLPRDRDRIRAAIETRIAAASE